jgi:hypothetical protein
MTSACPFPVPVRHRSEAAGGKKAPGGASEIHLLNRCELKPSDACICYSYTPGGRPECGKISAVCYLWSTWECILTLLAEPELVGTTWRRYLYSTVVILLSQRTIYRTLKALFRALSEDGSPMHLRELSFPLRPRSDAAPAQERDTRRSCYGC